MKHNLKTMKCYFDAILDGSKRFEIRNNIDRGFQKDDFIIFRLLDKGKLCGYDTDGCHIEAKVDYVTNYMQKENYVVFGFTVTNIITPPDWVRI